MTEAACRERPPLPGGFTEASNNRALFADLGHLLGLLLCGYLIGHLGWSFLWITTVFVVILFHRQRRFRLHRQHQESALLDAIQENEQSTVEAYIRLLPKWVHFPDTEKSEWANLVLQQLWPYLHESLERLLRNQMQPNIANALPEWLRGFRFASINFGSTPPRIGSVKCYRVNAVRDEIILDVEVIYSGDLEIGIRLLGLPAGFKKLLFRGQLRLELQPLLKQWPIVGCLSFYFLGIPRMEYSLTKVGKLLSISGLDYYLKQAIVRQLARRLVLPNKQFISLAPNVDPNAFQLTPPIGMIEVQLIEARNVKSTFSELFGSSNGKVYARMIIGSEEFCTNASSNVSRPRWDFHCRVPVFLLSQVITFEVMYTEEAPICGEKDEYLGSASVSVEAIANEGSIENNFDLVDSKKGTIRVKATWNRLCHQRPTKSKVQKKSALTMAKSLIADEGGPSLVNYVSKHQVDVFDNFTTQFDLTETIAISNVPPSSQIPPVACLLVVQLNRASNLPMSMPCEPSPQVILHLPASEAQKSSIASFTCNPFWGESFHFLIEHFDAADELTIEVVDGNRVQEHQIGQGSLPLQALLEAPDMTRTEPLTIHCSGNQTDQQFLLQLAISLYFTPVDA